VIVDIPITPNEMKYIRMAKPNRIAMKSKKGKQNAKNKDKNKDADDRS
jgi:hypothetical protein